MSLCSSVRVVRLGLLTMGALTMVSISNADAAQAIPAPTNAEKSELAKYPAWSGSLDVLEANKDSGLHTFLETNDGKTVYLDLSIVRYVPIDPSSIDKPEVRVATDRFENPVFSKCWPDQKAEYMGILNFGEEGFPLPLDAADIESGCKTRVRFDLQMINSVGAFPKLWGDNKVQVFLKGFFSVHKSTLDHGKTLYTLKEEEGLPLETYRAFNKHKTKNHAQAKLSLEKRD